ncbi:hypothetical protein MRB53_040781 [Persea americana]|nr:hypothetical protein MRB53_040781 [Persea americana]
MPPPGYARVRGAAPRSSQDESSPSPSARRSLLADRRGDDDDDLREGFELQEFDRVLGPREGDTLGDGDDDDDDDPDDDHHHRASSSTTRPASVQSFELYTPDEERRVRRKLDLRLVVFVALLFMLSFLDRSNIGNAKIAGLSRDLHLSDAQYAWLLTAFYISYICFEWMTLCYTLFPPHIYISCCVFAWGVLASSQSLVSSFGSLLVLRLFLGMGEAAFVGIPIYLSFFFRRDELAFRTGLFISAAPLATTFASSLAYAIVRFGDRINIANWRLLFLLEGFPACLIAVWTWYWIPDRPATTHWLSRRERKVAALRMRKEEADGETLDHTTHYHDLHRRRRFAWAEVRHTLVDPKSYLTAGMFFCCNVAYSSMPVFLPTIVQQMGYGDAAAQGLSAPPFVGAFLAVIATAIISDRCHSRSLPIMFHATIAMVGYILLASAAASHLGNTVRYLAVFPICAGFFSAVTLVITWTINNQASNEGKGTGMAVLNVIGQCGPLLGTQLYPDSEGPFYSRGMTVCAVAMGLVVVLAVVLRVVLLRENARRTSHWKATGDNGADAEGVFLYMV